MAQEVLVIEAGRAERHYWQDLWRYRELFYILAWRDVLVRYKQTVIGITWAVVRPLTTMVVFTLVFGTLGKFPSDGLPYALFVFVATLPWQLFSSSLTEASNSLLGNTHLVSKVYFPRLIVPVSAIVTALIDFLVAASIMVGLMAWYGVWPDWRFTTLPLFALIALGSAIGGGLWLAALNVKYRDFRYVVPFLLQLGLYISPVGFSSGIVPDRWRTIYSANPMVGAIDGFRWSLTAGATDLHLPGLLISAALTAMLLVSGVWYFRRMERTFADEI